MAPQAALPRPEVGSRPPHLWPQAPVGSGPARAPRLPAPPVLGFGSPTLTFHFPFLLLSPFSLSLSGLFLHFLLFFLALGGSGYVAGSRVACPSPSTRSQPHKYTSPRSTTRRPALWHAAPALQPQPPGSPRHAEAPGGEEGSHPDSRGKPWGDREGLGKT